MKITEIDMKELHPSPTNPRKFFDPKKMADLAGSIKEKGILQPLLVRVQDKPKGYEIIAGECRYRASKIAGRDQVPCIIRDDLNDQQVVEFQIVENVQRGDLTPLEEAVGYRKLIDDFKYSMDDLALKIGKPKAYITMRFKLLTLSPACRKALESGALALAMAMELLRAPSHDDQDEILKECAGMAKWNPEYATAKDVRDAIDSNFMLDLSKAPFNTKDATLCPKAGACEACPKRTGVQSGLFGDDKKSTCLDKACWELKVETQGQKLVAKLKAEGKEVLQGDAAEKLLESPHSRGFVLLDEKVTDLVGATTTRQALRKNAVEDRVPVTAVINDEGRVEQFVRINDVQRALPKKAFKANAERSTGSGTRAGKMSTKDRQKRQQRLAELKAGRTIWPLLWPKAIEKVTAKPLTGQGLRTFLEVLVEYHADNDMRGPAEERINKGEHDIEEELLAAKSDKAMLILVWQMMIGSGQLSFDEARISESANEVLKIAGIDWKKELAAEAKKILAAREAKLKAQVPGKAPAKAAKKKAKGYRDVVAK